MATSVLSSAELAIFVYDGAQLRDQPSAPRSSLELPTLAPQVPAIHVINKTDLLSAAERNHLLQHAASILPEASQPHFISALNGEGIADLISAIARALVPESPPSGLAVPFAQEQFDALTKISAAITQRDAVAATELLHAMLTSAS